MSRGGSPWWAEAVGDEPQVLFEALFRPGGADELDNAAGGVIGEPVDLLTGRAVRVGGEGARILTVLGRSRRAAGGIVIPRFVAVFRSGPSHSR